MNPPHEKFEFVSMMGIRGDEPRRVERITCGTRPPEDITYLPLAKAGITKKDVADFWAGHPEQAAPSHLGNCTFCFLKSAKNLRQAHLDDPGGVEWWRSMEEKYQHLFLGYQSDGKSIYAEDRIGAEPPQFEIDFSVPCECLD